MPDPSDDSARPAKRARIEENDAAATNTTTTATALDTVLVSATAPTPAPIPSAPATVDADLEREVRAGITEYVCPDNLGFTGVLKQRYTDFLVNEIGLDGEVVHLKSTEVPRKGKGGRENGMDGGVVMVAEAEGTAGPVTKLIEEGGDAATESVSVEHALEQTESATPQNDGQHEHVTIEGDEPVCSYVLGCLVLFPHLLTLCSSLRKTALRYTRYSAKTPQGRLWPSLGKYGNANTKRQKTSKLSLHRP